MEVPGNMEQRDRADDAVLELRGVSKHFVIGQAHPSGAP